MEKLSLKAQAWLKSLSPKEALKQCQYLGAQRDTLFRILESLEALSSSKNSEVQLLALRKKVGEMLQRDISEEPLDQLKKRLLKTLEVLDQVLGALQTPSD